MRAYVDMECAPAGSAVYRHEEDVRTVRSITRESNTDAINVLIHSAYEDLSITGEQLYAELEEGSNLPNIYSGTLTSKALRLTAETLALCVTL